MSHVHIEVNQIQLNFLQQKQEELREENFSLHCEISKLKDVLKLKEEIIQFLENQNKQMENQIKCLQEQNQDSPIIRARAISKKAQFSFNEKSLKIQNIQKILENQEEYSENDFQGKKNSQDNQLIKKQQQFEKNMSPFLQDYINQISPINKQLSLKQIMKSFVSDSNKFFQVNEMIFYNVESPIMRYEIVKSEKQLEIYEQMVRRWIQKIKPQTKNYKDGYFSILSGLAEEFSKDMQNFEKNEEIASLLYLFIKFFKEYKAFYEMLQFGFDNVFFQPIKQLYKQELVQHKELRKKYQKLQDDFDAIQFKYMTFKQNKRDKENSIQQFLQLQNQYVKIFNQLEECKLEYIKIINSIKMKFNIEITDKICSLLYSHLVNSIILLFNLFQVYFSQCFDLISNVEQIIDLHSENTVIKNQSTIELTNKNNQANQKIQDFFNKLQNKLYNSNEQVQIDNKIHEKEGFLIQKDKSLKQTKYIQLNNGCFIQIEFDVQTNQLNQKTLANLLLSNVKEIFSKKYKNCFEIICNTNSNPIFFICDNQTDYKEWLQAIKNQIEINIQSSPIETKKHTQNIIQQQQMKNDIEKQKKIDKIISKNVCADCGAQEPSWYSQNLFVLLCLNCSGIHRKMGSNVSRIKSLKLDINNPQCIEFFQNFGTTSINLIWEANIFNYISEKPNSQSPLQQKEQWIKMKYVQKLFLIPLFIDGNILSNVNFASNQQQFLNLITKAICNNDIQKLIKIISLNLFNINDMFEIEGKKQSIFHFSCKYSNPILLEILINSNAKFDILDEQNYKPLDLAMLANKEDNVNYLVTKIEESLNS